MFATVKGAGHMAVALKKPESFYMFDNFLNNTGVFEWNH